MIKRTIVSNVVIIKGTPNEFIRKDNANGAMTISAKIIINARRKSPKI